MNRHANNPRPSCAAVTLLEFLLAIALSAVVMGLVATAIRVQLRIVDAGRAEVEQSQLARAILRHMANDLRGAIYAEPVDLSDTLELASSLSVPSDSEDDDAAADDESDEDDSEDSPLSNSVEPREVPGLYGNQHELQFDISRLPRIDEYGSDAVLGKATADVPSDLKTVTWYLESSTTRATATTSPVSGPSVSGQTPADGGGLMRCELSRATTSYAIESGNIAGLAAGESFAPEVVSMEFRYFDGTTWHVDWDSTERGGLPMAVEIAIALRRDEEKADLLAPTLLATGDLQPPRSLAVYRLMVYLPLAQPTDADDANQTGSQ